MKKIKEHKYFNLGMMILAVVAASLVLLAVVLNLGAVSRIVKKILDVFSPIALGVVIAYLLNPLMNFMDRLLLPLLQKRRWKKEGRAKKVSRVLSLIFAVLCAAILVYEFFAMLLPQLYESILGIVNNFSAYYAAVETWVMTILEDNPSLALTADNLMDKLFTYLEGWLSEGLLGSVEVLLSQVTNSVKSVISVAIDLIIGICAAVYMLWSRDTFKAQSKKLIVALLSQRSADRLLAIGQKTHKVFSGFIIGKIVDSLIIGILCYIGMLILKMPYAALIATVVGVTNVIPFFGPVIGAIPCAFLILLVDPLKALYFVIFILGLQQLDGNVIGPRILGDTVGISGFWVLVSITVASGLFGFTGMLLGVPVFAVLYMLIKEFVEFRLKTKGEPVASAHYQTIQQVSDLQKAGEDEPQA